MKDLLILQDLKTLGSKKGKGAKKSSVQGFAELLFNPNSLKTSKTSANLLVMQNVYKAKNEIKYKDYKPISNSILADTLLNTKTNKIKESNLKEPNLLANLLQNPKNLNEKVSKIVQNAKQMNEILPPRLQITQAEIMQDVSDIINNTQELEYGKELFDDLNFVQILDFLNILKLDSKDAKLNDFKALKHIVTSETTLQTFSKTNNIHSLIELAKEHKLGIKNITYEKIKNNEYNEKIFAKPYPKLYEQNFFAHALSKDNKNLKQPVNKTEPLKDLLVQKTMQINEQKKPIEIVKNDNKIPETTLKSGALNELLSKLSKQEPAIQQQNKKSLNTEPIKNIAINNEKILKDNTPQQTKPIETIKEITKEITKDTVKEITQEIIKDTQQENINQESETLEQIKPSSEIKMEQKLSLPESLKIDFLNPNKTLSKEQTRQVIDNFTRDFKEELERFKAPSHRVNISLNPKELGEINVTMIARGNNLHINLNSQNQNTLNLFVANQQEFKNSLVNMGFTGLAMNFGDKKDGQREQEQQKARKKYEEIEELESTNDMPSGINAVLYKYF